MQVNSQIPANACIASFTSVYIQSKGQMVYNLAERYYTDKAYDYLGREVIYSGAAIGFIGDAYKRKEARMSFPVKPWVNNFSMDIGQNEQKYELYWEFKF